MLLAVLSSPSQVDDPLSGLAGLSAPDGLAGLSAPGGPVQSHDPLAGLIEAYNSKPNKAWGYFHEESGAYPFSGWLQQLIDQELDFVRFSSQATEHLKTLMEGSNLALGGHVLYIRYRQGMTAFLVIALLHHTEGVPAHPRDGARRRDVRRCLS